MKKSLRVIAIALMLISLLLLVPSGINTAQAEIIEYKLTEKKGVKLQADGYLYEEGEKDPYAYEDPSISIRIEKGRIYETNYVAARVKIANATQIRSMMASSYYSPSTLMGTSIAKSVNAALAINGDYFPARKGKIYVARQGKEYSNMCNGEYDVLVIDSEGDLHIIEKPVFKKQNGKVVQDDMGDFKAKLEAEDRTIVNGFTFGPGLVINGVRQTGYVDHDNAALTSAQRMCLAQVGPLEYLCIVSEGPEDPGSVGLTLEQFSELVASFEGVQNAYNLDGGSSSTMVFKTGGHNFDKINSPNNPKRRPLYDIIYFASAYQPD
ncbi:MAG: phosphodiester glycosidase family protein [Clostridiales bacterium]|nr:phosphodiester glycosidase family protein [Clostridiales bacterium]